MIKKITKILLITLVIFSGWNVVGVNAATSTIDIKDVKGDEAIDNVTYSSALALGTYEVYKVTVDLDSDITSNAIVEVKVPEEYDIATVSYEQGVLIEPYLSSTTKDDKNRVIRYEFKPNTTGQYEITIGFKITRLVGVNDDYDVKVNLLDGNNEIDSDTYNLTNMTLLLAPELTLASISGDEVQENAEVTMKLRISQSQSVQQWTDINFMIPLPEGFEYIENSTSTNSFPFTAEYDRTNHVLNLTSDRYLPTFDNYVVFKMKAPSISSAGATDTYNWNRATDIDFSFDIAGDTAVDKSNYANINGKRVLTLNTTDTTIDVVDSLELRVIDIDKSPDDYYIGTDDELLFQYAYNNLTGFDAENFKVEHTFSDPLRVRTLRVNYHIGSVNPNVTMSYKTNLDSTVQTFEITGANRSPHPIDDLNLKDNEYITWVQVDYGTITNGVRNYHTYTTMMYSSGTLFYGDVDTTYEDEESVLVGENVSVTRKTTATISGSTYTEEKSHTLKLTDQRKITSLLHTYINGNDNGYLIPGEEFSMKLYFGPSNSTYNYGDTNTFLSLDNPTISFIVPKEFVVNKSDVEEAFEALGKKPAITEEVDYDGAGSTLFVVQFYGDTDSNTGIELSRYANEDYDKGLSYATSVNIPMSVALDADTGVGNYFGSKQILGFNAFTNPDTEPRTSYTVGVRKDEVKIGTNTIDTNNTDLDRDGVSDDSIVTSSSRYDSDVTNLTITKPAIFLTSGAQKSDIDNAYKIYDSNDVDNTTNTYLPDLMGKYRLEILNGSSVDHSNYVAYVKIPKGTGNDDVSFDLQSISGADEFVVEYSTDASPTKNELDDNASTVDTGYSTTPPANLDDVTMVKLSKASVPGTDSGNYFNEVVEFDIQVSATNTSNEIGKTSEMQVEYGSTSEGTRKQYTTSKTVMRLNGYEVNGYVFADDNRNGTNDAGEALEAADVQLHDATGNIVATTQTNAEGYYEFADTLIGQGKVKIDYDLGTEERFTYQEKTGISEAVNSNVNSSGEYEFDIRATGTQDNINAGIAKIATVRYELRYDVVNMPYTEDINFEISDYGDDLTISYEELNGNVTYAEKSLVSGVGVLELDGIKGGYTTLKINVVDEDGFSSNDTIILNVTNEAPVITTDNIRISINETFDPLTGVTVSDFEDDLHGQDVTLEVVSNNVDTSAVGGYEVVYKATDTAGNETLVTRVISVYDDTVEFGQIDAITAKSVVFELSEVTAYTTGELENEIVIRSAVKAWNTETAAVVAYGFDSSVVKKEVGDYSLTFETEHGTTKTITVYVVEKSICDKDCSGGEAEEAVVAQDFTLGIDEVADLTDEKVIEHGNARGINLKTDEELDLEVDRNAIKAEFGSYDVIYSTENGTSLTVKATVGDNLVIKDGLAIAATDVVMYDYEIEKFNEDRSLLNDEIISRSKARVWEVDTNTELTPVVADSSAFDFADLDANSYKIDYSYEDNGAGVSINTIGNLTVKNNGTVIGDEDVIDASDFALIANEVAGLTDEKVIKLAEARAWLLSDFSEVEIVDVDYSKIEAKQGIYDVTFTTEHGTSTTIQAFVGDETRPIIEKTLNIVIFADDYKLMISEVNSMSIEDHIEAANVLIIDKDTYEEYEVTYTDVSSVVAKEGLYGVKFGLHGKTRSAEAIYADVVVTVEDDLVSTGTINYGVLIFIGVGLFVVARFFIKRKSIK